MKRRSWNEWAFDTRSQVSKEFGELCHFHMLDLICAADVFCTVDILIHDRETIEQTIEHNTWAWDLIVTQLAWMNKMSIRYTAFNRYFSNLFAVSLSFFIYFTSCKQTIVDWESVWILCLLGRLMNLNRTEPEGRKLKFKRNNLSDDENN